MKTNNSFTVIGLMSGTSLDGLDIAYCSFDLDLNDQVTFKLNACKTYEYPDDILKLLTSALVCDAAGLALRNSLYAEYLAQKIQEFLVETGMNPPQLISSHGHTLFHQPGKYSYQLGSGAVIAAKTGITTVCDFRSTDVALGGQGAPLVPVGDRDLFPAYQACLNLGGIANISFDRSGKRIAFDICPVNMALNNLANELGLLYDKDGNIAQNNEVNSLLLNSLNQLEFYEKVGAKSLGREWYEKYFLPLIKTVSVETALATVTQHIAEKISQELRRNHLTQVLLTGGGTRNKFLVKRISELSDAEIMIPEEDLIDFKEALIFAYLGFLRIKNKTNALASVTGAIRDSSSGAIYLAK